MASLRRVMRQIILQAYRCSSARRVTRGLHPSERQLVARGQLVTSTAPGCFISNMSTHGPFSFSLMTRSVCRRGSQPSALGSRRSPILMALGRFGGRLSRERLAVWSCARVGRGRHSITNFQTYRRCDHFVSYHFRTGPLLCESGIELDREGIGNGDHWCQHGSFWGYRSCCILDFLNRSWPASGFMIQLIAG